MPRLTFKPGLPYRVSNKPAQMYAMPDQFCELEFSVDLICVGNKKK